MSGVESFQHPPLVKHQHPGCYEVMIALEECHKSGFWSRFSGQCNEYKKELTLCLRAEVRMPPCWCDTSTRGADFK